MQKTLPGMVLVAVDLHPNRHNLTKLTVSDCVLQGLEWVAKNHIKPAVVHMSIEGGFSSIVNQAVEQLIKVNHVHVVVSSGGCTVVALHRIATLPQSPCNGMQQLHHLTNAR